LICDATSLPKYIDRSSNIFFVFGSEVILRNNSIDHINKHFKDKGFSEKKIITENDFSNIEKIILENAGGSLFGSQTIIEIIHNGGKVPKEILNIFEIKDINNLKNIVVIIRSAIEKINKNTKWVKKLDSLAIVVQCNKLKSFEEMSWIKNQLTFMNDEDAKEYSNRIKDVYSGNLIAQQNEINILKLTYSEDGAKEKLEFDDAEFLPYELEDKIIELNTNYALRIAKSIKKNDEHYGPLLVWIMGKIINISVGSHQDKISLEKAGVWRNKISNYQNFIKQNPLKKMIPLQKKIYELDMASKGLAGITKDQFWQELDNMIIDLTST